MGKYRPYHETNIERIVRLGLQRREDKFERQKQFGRYFCDFYLPDRNIVIEADGERWHPDRMVAQKSLWGRKKYLDGLRRDHYLTTQHNLRVIHLRGADIHKDIDYLLRKSLDDE